MMSRQRVIRLWAPVILLGGMVLAGSSLQVLGQSNESGTQANSSVTQALLDKAHGFETRGRMDLASQTWQQVLLADPNNSDALGGLARAAKLDGNTALSNTYLEKLRAINPRDPNIARVESMGAQQNQMDQLRQAGKLAEGGQYAAAMALYRQVFGTNPPPGDWSLAYYETESATEDGRPHSITGLAALVEKYPGDARYQIALGRILTYNPKTREEGRKYLERFPANSQANDALRQSLLWDSGDPAMTPRIRAYLATHHDPQLASALQGATGQTVADAAVTKTVVAKRTAAAAVPPSRTEPVAPPAKVRPGDVAAAYKALNAKQIDEAEARFKAILAKQPENAKALAGMGYVRMQQGNFSGALSFLEQAKHDNSTDKGLEAALDTSRFWFIMSEGQSALDADDLTAAEKQYRAALALRPDSPEATEGLGGTLLKAQQPAAALPLFAAYAKAKPGDPDGWRGLFQAQFQAGNAPLALATERQIPAAPHVELMKDPLFLRTLASAYSSVGRDADAQRVLEGALALPFPADAKSEKADTQLQFAAILLEANHLDQAAALYRQVLAADHADTPAWQGLVRVEHAMGHDAEALQTVESMPPASYALAMRDPGFETTVASIYQAEKKLDVAEDLLDKAIAQQTTAGQKPSIGMEMQLAGIYAERGNTQLAYPIFQRVLIEDSSRADAWAGLLAALHATGHDQDAIAQVQLIAPSVRAQLEMNIGYLQTMASVYGAVGQSREASLFLARAEQFYAAQHTAPPADVEIQNAWLLYNGVDDAGLYRQLMGLGSRPDLTETQRRTVQTIWTNWAVRRANQAAAEGNSRRALAILNAAARSFPDNPAVLKALASGYARAGQPAQAVAIYKAQNLTSASVADYQGAVGAALAAEDSRDADTWLRHALEAYPADPQILILAARFEQSRGNTTRAIAYYRESLRNMPPGDSGSALASELGLSEAGRLPNASQPQDLSILLAPGMGELTPVGTAPGTQGQPYLPSYNGAYGPPPSSGAPGVVPPYMSNPQPQAQPDGKGGLKDSTPQSRRGRGPGGRYQGPAQVEVAGLVTAAVRVELGESPALSLLASRSPASPQAEQRQQIAGLDQQTSAQSLPRGREDAFGAFVPYVAPPRIAPADPTGVLLTAKYVANAHGSSLTSSHPDIAAAEAADIRRHQSDTGSISPVGQDSAQLDDASTPPMHNAVYTPPPELVAQNQSGPMVAQPSSPPAGQPGGVNDSGQQYAQPRAAAAPAQPSAPRRRVLKRRPAPAASQASEPTALAPEPTPAESVPSAPATGASVAAQPPSMPAYPPIGPPFQFGATPSDAELLAGNQPPLRGRYSDRSSLAMTPRQQAESELAALEGSFSGWIGGTGIARYRSGTPGLDRLYDMEAPVEASAVVGHAVRLTVIPRPVFLNSGSLNTSVFATYSPSAVPYLGTLPASAVNPPAQQLANGIGGEFQLTTRNLGLAAGYTPYEFLVRNITGRFRWRPAGGHITLFGERDSVKDTQLSYAGLRDPGSISPTYSGTIWGGVIASTGGARLDFGSGGTGFYLSGDGGILRGDHVLDNTKYEGSTGAYFRVKNWPEHGSLTLGGALFGMHYAQNELGLTYGQGGYFSPNYYFLASVPVAFNGHNGSNFHYGIAGAVGVQTFRQDFALFYPLDPGLQSGLQSRLNCTLSQLAAHICGQYPVSGNTGFNYAVNSEVSYRYREHWYLGAFVFGNNTNNYNTVSGGFFFRYVFRSQHEADGYPTGLFPVDGFRPLQIP